jgi:hypothetical protein
MLSTQKCCRRSIWTQQKCSASTQHLDAAGGGAALEQQEQQG